MYLFGLGLDIPVVNLIPVKPQPRSQGVRAARITYAASGAIHQENLYIELEWDALDEDDYMAVLTQFNLINNERVNVTMRLPSKYYQWNVFSGEAIRPLLGEDVRRQNFFVRGIALTIRNLRPSTG